MKTLHFISLNSRFVSIHVFVRFTYASRYFVADNDYAFLIKTQSLFKRLHLKKHVPYVEGVEEQVVH